MEREMPVNIRNHVANFGDPYLPSLDIGEVAVCRECKSVYADKRWELPQQAAEDLAKAAKILDALCPACRKIKDRVPGGIVELTGAFVREHETEIVNLVRNENNRAMEINPIERIMDIQKSANGLTIQTTNEKLAQRIGRAVYKSYSGDVDYKWSEDNKLARVYWHRD
ncbi:MAG TPA: ATPase [Armatimonadetes bacterium]|jgi:NMD protein affecting ribosome stability and mRNA decay|nr:ATPase [Armatimonadota bacterium]